MCPWDQVCNLEEDKYAWVTAKYQIKDYQKGKDSAGNSLNLKTNSQIYKKYTQKTCEPLENFL